MMQQSDNDITGLPEQVAHIFSEEGPLASISGFESRPEQKRMSIAVAKAVEEGSHLIVEAGTGIGKSLAYLIPAILHSLETGRKAIICTHTINLQEQLLYKDLPLLQKMLDISFDAVLLKGRQNYLCPTRLERAFLKAGDLFDANLLPELERLRHWSETTTDGTLSDLPEEPNPEVWAHVCSERHLCTPKICGKNSRCFYQAIRRRALSADVLILNHSLFFTLLEDSKNSEHGFLFPHDFVIFDEAHTLENIASRHLGLSISQFGLRQQLQRLYNPRTHKGIFQQLKAPTAITAVAEALPEVDLFFDALFSVCDFKQGREYRIRKESIDHLHEKAPTKKLRERLTHLETAITGAIATLEEKDDILKNELHDLVEFLSSVKESLDHFMEQRLENHVYWVEKTGRTTNYLTLHAIPVDIASHLQDRLFSKETSAILTSATLSTGAPQLHYFRSRIGGMKVPVLELGSPFNYEKQMKLHLVKTMPDPRDPKYEEALEKWIKHFTEQSQARTFVLFTSYRGMHSLAAKMKDFFEEKKWQLLVQGEGLSRSLMLDKFRSGKPSVLFGTDSFWAGVDIPGDALSNVMITRLPFTTPDHPLTEAKFEQITATGGNAFSDYSLPEAILKFRQGVGRLIRNKNDHGSIVVLDSRMATKSYGRAFLKALPKCPVEII